METILAKPIKRFAGKHEFLSNFFFVEIEWQGIKFRTLEHAYQASKSIDPQVWQAMSKITFPGQAKNYGNEIAIRKDWPDVKIGFMWTLLVQKFTNNTYLKEQLLATGDVELVEGNYWGDTFWGVCKGEGQNNLGKLLMKLRSNLKKENESKHNK